jgi:hypothetical protein
MSENPYHMIKDNREVIFLIKLVKHLEKDRNKI